MSEEKFNFKKSLKRLEEITQKLDDPELDLEDALKLLEEAVKLHKLCKDKITKYEAKIKEILRDEDEED